VREVPSAEFAERSGGPLAQLRAHLSPNGYVVDTIAASVGDPAEVAREILRKFGPMGTDLEVWGTTPPEHWSFHLAGVIGDFFHPRREALARFDARLFRTFLTRRIRGCTASLSVEGSDADLADIIRIPPALNLAAGRALASHLRQMDAVGDAAAAEAVRLLAAYLGAPVPDDA
jgi:hypothetical protein